MLGSSMVLDIFLEGASVGAAGTLEGLNLKVGHDMRAHIVFLRGLIATEHAQVKGRFGSEVCSEQAVQITTQSVNLSVDRIRGNPVIRHL